MMEAKAASEKLYFLNQKGKIGPEQVSVLTCLRHKSMDEAEMPADDYTPDVLRESAERQIFCMLKPPC
jgi:hypothetical protein